MRFTVPSASDSTLALWRHHPYWVSSMPACDGKPMDHQDRERDETYIEDLGALEWAVDEPKAGAEQSEGDGRDDGGAGVLGNHHRGGRLVLGDAIVVLRFGEATAENIGVHRSHAQSEHGCSDQQAEQTVLRRAGDHGCCQQYEHAQGDRGAAGEEASTEALCCGGMSAGPQAEDCPRETRCSNDESELVGLESEGVVGDDGEDGLRAEVDAGYDEQRRQRCPAAAALEERPRWKERPQGPEHEHSTDDDPDR